LIKKIPDEHLEKAKQIAYETVAQFAKQQNLTNYHYDQNELEQLTSSQAVAQHTRQVINQIRQQQQGLQALNSFSGRTSEERQ
jgi:hypothetical protein